MKLTPLLWLLPSQQHVLETLQLPDQLLRLVLQKYGMPCLVQQAVARASCPGSVAYVEGAQQLSRVVLRGLSLIGRS